MRPADWTWNTPLSLGIIAVALLGLAPLFGWALAAERWTILAVLIVLALVPVFVRWPVVSTFGVYALMVPFDALAGFLTIGGATTLMKLIGIWAIAGLIGTGLMERRLGSPPLAAFWLCLFTMWAVLSAAWALNTEMVFERFPAALGLFALYLVAVSFKPSRSEFHCVCLLVVVGGAMAAAAGYMFGVEDTSGAAVRGRLVLGDHETNPNKLGAVLILPSALALASAVGSRGVLQRAIAVGLVGLIGFGIFISMSRGALVALIATISVFLYRMRVRWQTVAPLMLLSFLATLMPDTFYHRIGIVLTGEETTGAGRTEIWKTGFKVLEEFWLWGAGLSNFLEAYGRVSPGFWHAAHNVYLMVWVELGILGLVLLIAALISHLVAVRRARKAGGRGIALAALEAALVGVLVVSFFGDQLWRKFFWLTLILLTWATYCDVVNQQLSKERFGSSSFESEAG